MHTRNPYKIASLASDLQETLINRALLAFQPLGKLRNPLKMGISTKL
jgi:hypothetical protein